MEPDYCVGVREAARTLDVSPDTIMRWCREGLLGTAYKGLGERKTNGTRRLEWYIPLSAIDALRANAGRF